MESMSADPECYRSVTEALCNNVFRLNLILSVIGCWGVNLLIGWASLTSFGGQDWDRIGTWNKSDIQRTGNVVFWNLMATNYMVAFFVSLGSVMRARKAVRQFHMNEEVVLCFCVRDRSHKLGHVKSIDPDFLPQSCRIWTKFPFREQNVFRRALYVSLVFGTLYTVIGCVVLWAAATTVVEGHKFTFARSVVAAFIACQVFVFGWVSGSLSEHNKVPSTVVAIETNDLSVSLLEEA